MIWFFLNSLHGLHYDCLSPQTEYGVVVAATSLLVCCEQNGLSHFFQINYTLSTFHDQYLTPRQILGKSSSTHTSSNRKQCLQGKDKIRMPSPFLYFSRSSLFSSINEFSITSIVIFNLHTKSETPPHHLHINNKRKQGPGQVRLCVHSIFTLLNIQLNRWPISCMESLIFACLIWHNLWLPWYLVVSD